MVTSGIRWYRTLPSETTQTVVASKNALWVGSDPRPTYQYTPITQIETFEGQQDAPVSFASTFDPAANNGSGSDILVICGFTGPYSFARKMFTVSGTPQVGQTVSITMVKGATTVTVGPYTAVATDTPQSITDQIVALVNASAAVTPGTPFLTQVYSLLPANTNSPQLFFGALVAGDGGNAITVQISIGGAGVSVSPGGVQNLVGGGNLVSAPVKYDGATVTGLSSQITQAFTNCVSWHDHVWFWGDSDNPDTLYAADIDQPEGFSFMAQTGGYQIGAGDGDPGIRNCVPIGNILYVFKSNSMFAVTGYDFQTGEYEFQVQPAIQGVGTPNAQSVATVDNKLIFWSGSAFYRLIPGAFTLEYIGRPIPIVQGQIQNGNQLLVRAVGGDFIYQSRLNEAYTGNPTTVATELFDSVALFAFDSGAGAGTADTIAVFDDAASEYLGNYAWSIWTGWLVDGWIPFGGGPSASGQPEEPKLLCWCPPAGPGGPMINAFGTDPAADSGLEIPWFAQTGWAPLGTSAKVKELHKIYLEIECTSGVFMSFTITPDIQVQQNGTVVTNDVQSGSFGGTGSTPNVESHQTLVAQMQPYIPAGALIFAFSESTGTSNFEMLELTLDFIENPIKS